MKFHTGARVLVIFFLIVLCIPFSQAVVIGANKGVLDFTNVMKNGYAQELVTFTTDTDFNLSITFEPKGEIKEWVRIDPPTNPFYISRNNPGIVAIIIEPPDDARIEKYGGSLEFLTGALAGPEGQFGTAVRTAITISFGVQVTGQQILSCSVQDITMSDVEEGYPLEFYAVVTNKGNVRIKPEFIMEFWNQDQSKIIETYTFNSENEILPTVQRRVFNSISQKLPLGQYWVRIKTPMCGESGSGFLTVSVIERGGVSDRGELISIDNTVDARVGQIVPIDAVFVNLGSRVVSAKFKGTITSGGPDNIFKIIDTEPIDVDPGKTERIRTYFNPVQEGKYEITGRVLYNRKLTYDKMSILNVYPADFSISDKSIFGNLIIPVSLFILAIIVILLIIRKKRQGR